MFYIRVPAIKYSEWESTAVRFLKPHRGYIIICLCCRITVSDFRNGFIDHVTTNTFFTNNIK
jgi:hypothetical protein